MSLTILVRLPAVLGLATLLAWAAPAYAAPSRHLARPHLTTGQRIDLYAPRVRRSTIMYLRLRLLELREAGLERARAAIERRLSIDELLADPYGAAGGKPAPRPQPAQP